MLKTIIVFCFILFSFCLTAQTSYPFFNNMKGERKIVADTVITRVAPSTGAAFDDTLYFGDAIEILMTVPFTEVRNNMVSPWLKVVYQKGKFKKIGFVSAIDVALNSKIVCKNYEFVWSVIANNKKDSLVNNELATKNNYACKLVASKEGKKIAETNFNLSNEQGIDSFIVRILAKSKLNKTLFTIEYNNYSLKDTTKEYYTHHFMLCQNNQFAELPVTHNYIVKPKIGFPISLITFKNKNTFLLRTEFLQMMPEHIVDTYKWQNCSYILSE